MSSEGSAFLKTKIKKLKHLKTKKLLLLESCFKYSSMCVKGLQVQAHTGHKSRPFLQGP